MSAYPFNELVSRWMQGDLTSEQAIGQILQHLQSLQERVGRLERKASLPHETPNPTKGPIKKK